MELRKTDNFNLLTAIPFDYELDESQKNSSIEEGFNEHPLQEDLWSFGFFWTEIVQRFSSVEQLYDTVTDLKNEIATLKEKYRPAAGSFPHLEIEKNWGGGVSGSYHLVDNTGKRHFFVKPLDEDAGCIHSDRFATPFVGSPLREGMPLYRAAMREVLAYRVAVSIGVSGVIPKTELGILESDKFHDFSEGIASVEVERYLEKCGYGEKEKLCSVQEYVENGKSLFEALQDLQMAGLTDEEIGKKFDKGDFEDANILLWSICETDGHLGNFLVYPKSVDEIGNEILGIKKIDSGLAFPDRNRQLRNNLTYLPNANEVLSETGKRKIASIDVENLTVQFDSLGLESSVPALYERIKKLKELAQRPGITISEMNAEMAKIGKKR